MTAARKVEGAMKTNSQETRIALVEQSISYMNEALLRIEKKIDSLDHKVEDFNSRLWSNFYWILGTMFTIASASAALMAKGFGWFH